MPRQRDIVISESPCISRRIHTEGNEAKRAEKVAALGGGTGRVGRGEARRWEGEVRRRGREADVGA